MKKGLLGIIITSFAFTAASDNTGIYISAKGGYSFITSSKTNTKYKFIDLKDNYDLDSKLKNNYTYGPQLVTIFTANSAFLSVLKSNT